MVKNKTPLKSSRKKQRKVDSRKEYLANLVSLQKANDLHDVSDNECSIANNLPVESGTYDWPPDKSGCITRILSLAKG